MKDGVAVLVMAGDGKIDQPLLQLKRLPTHHFRNYAGSKLLKQVCIATDESAIEQRNIEFKVVAMKLAALRQGSGCGADAKMQIPERLAHAWNRLLLRGFAEGGFMQEKHIDIGTGKQSPAAVTAERRDADPIRPGRTCGRLILQLAYQRICKIRALPDCSLPVA